MEFRIINFFFFCVLHSRIISYTTSEKPLDMAKINCVLPSPYDIYSSITIDALYNRNSLAIYTHPGTESVNLVIRDFKLTLKYFKKNIDDNKSPDYEEEILDYVVALGAGNLVKKQLMDCNFFIADAKTNHIFDYYENKFNMSEECLNNQICLTLNNFRKEHFEKTRFIDFGPVSILSLPFIESHPKLQYPCSYFLEPTQNAACIINDLMTYRLKLENKGLLYFPTDGRSSMFEEEEHKNITVRGATNINVNLKRIFVDLTSENEIWIQYRFNIPHLNVKFIRENKWRKPHFKYNSTIEFFDIEFLVTYYIEYEADVCTPVFYQLDVTEISDTKSYFYQNTGRIVHLSLTEPYVQQMNNEIMSLIKNKLANVLNNTLENNFNCDNIVKNRWDYPMKSYIMSD